MSQQIYIPSPESFLALKEDGIIGKDVTYQKYILNSLKNHGFDPSNFRKEIEDSKTSEESIQLLRANGVKFTHDFMTTLK